MDLDQDFDDNLDMEEEEEQVWRHAKPPAKMKDLRACIPCLLVKTYQQFDAEGCENCDKGEFSVKDKVDDCTTMAFEGLMAMTWPERSWVARWQFVSNFVPGVYALKVKGDVSPETAAELQEAGIVNIGRIMQQ